VLKWCGAAYLIWLGIRLWRAGGAIDTQPRTEMVSTWRMFGHAWLVTALNPKSITFFVAFLPQFIDPQADFLTQTAAFETTFLVLCFSNAFGYAVLASRARHLLRGARAIAVANKVAGALLVGAGVATATVRTVPK
jgi:threonine/homoserine/homoserine lactone efflux protein